MKMLVTGGAGFIGSNLVDRLLAEGHDVVAVDDLSNGKVRNVQRAQESPRFEFAQLDITTPEFVALVARVEPEVIFHLAAQVDVRVSVADPLLDAKLNIFGTINVAEAARQARVRKVLFTSSGGTIYGATQNLPIAETEPLDPLSPYAVSKVSGELYLKAYRDMHGLDYTTLALANVYGPRQDPHGEAGVVAIFGTALIEGRPTKIFGDGTSTRDYIYVGDVVEAFVRAADAPGGRRFNIGTSAQTTPLQLHRLIADALDAPDQPELAPARTGELQANALSFAAATEALGWSPGVDLATGVQLTMDWLRTTVT